MREESLLRVRALATHFFTEEGAARAVDGVDFEIERGRTLGLVGESGCGKSVTALSLLRLVPPPGRIVSGEVLFEGRDLLKLGDEEMRRVRGRRISIVFQEPMTSLNPVFTVGSQIAEVLVLHLGLDRKAARERSLELLRRVRMPSPETRVDDYPHQLSGGMRQRAMIAMALACEPSLLIADEPTTALDVTIQAQILDLLRDLQHEMRMSILFITHDVALLGEVADVIAVMYASRIVEKAPASEILENPLHPYTRGLLACRPSPRAGTLEPFARRRGTVMPGAVPDPLRFPTGCRFHPRCPLAEERCRLEEPCLRRVRRHHDAACHLVDSSGDDQSKGEEDQR